MDGRHDASASGLGSKLTDKARELIQIQVLRGHKHEAVLSLGNDFEGELVSQVIDVEARIDLKDERTSSRQGR